MGFLRDVAQLVFPSLTVKPSLQQQTDEDINLSVYVPAGGATEIFSYTVPNKSTMLVTHFGNYIGTFEAWGYITWVLLKNGVPIYPYHEMMDQIGYGSELRKVANTRFSGGDVFSVVIHNAYGENVACGVVLKYVVSEGK